MSVFLRVITQMDNDVDVADIQTKPPCNTTQFITGAITACANAPLKLRPSIQSDVAQTLGCHISDLAFLWTPAVNGAETLDCEIPDFRDSLDHSMPLQAAAE